VKKKGIVIPGKFESPAERARNALSDDLGRLILHYMPSLGWDTVVTDMASVVAGVIATHSDKPKDDLEKLAAYVRKYNWRRAKRLLFAAKHGLQPEDVGEKSSGQEQKKPGKSAKEAPEP